MLDLNWFEKNECKNTAKKSNDYIDSLNEKKIIEYKCYILLRYLNKAFTFSLQVKVRTN